MSEYVHHFTGTYDGRAGACVNCNADPYELLHDIEFAAEKASRLIGEYMKNRPPKASTSERIKLELDTFTAALRCKGYQP
jgi:hypothetical protein